jgi:Tfp pilus assembly protein PilF
MINRELARMHIADGQKALAAQQREAALREFRAAVQLDPQFAEGHYHLGMAYKEQGELTLAAESLDRRCDWIRRA